MSYSRTLRWVPVNSSPTVFSFGVLQFEIKTREVQTRRPKTRGLFLSSRELFKHTFKSLKCNFGFCNQISILMGFRCWLNPIRYVPGCNSRSFIPSQYILVIHLGSKSRCNLVLHLSGTFLCTPVLNSRAYRKGRSSRKTFGQANFKHQPAGWRCNLFVFCCCNCRRFTENLIQSHGDS